jgi:prepilin-type N-terminal cleavage/methylation domain-containing protein
MKKQDGFTLVELMVVVSITMILLAWGVPSFKTWNNKHGIENQMVQLYSDLQFGRMTGYGNKVVSGVYWGTGAKITGGYQIRYDNSSNPVANSIEGAVIQIGNTVYPKYPINVLVTPNQTLNSVSFDGRGFLNTVNEVNPATNFTFSVSETCGAAMDCVVVTPTKITLGKMTAGTCQPK